MRILGVNDDQFSSNVVGRDFGAPVPEAHLQRLDPLAAAIPALSLKRQPDAAGKST